MLARKKSLRLNKNKITLIHKILALLSLMRKITQIQKNGKKIFISILIIVTYVRVSASVAQR